ncbi:MAG: hypothetical protein ACPGKS_00990 [Coraliomargarita sp.]
MLYFISRWERAITIRSARAKCPFFKHLSYDKLFNSGRLPRGAYIFSDLDRLSLFETELASIIFRELQAAGMPVYNDPAQVLLRFDLLRALAREGVNDYKVYRPQYGEWPERYPVFLRRNTFHLGAQTEQLHSKEELETAMQQLLDAGIPHRNTMAVEYAAEGDANGLFRKYSVYRIGDRYFQDTTVNQKSWVVKSGEAGVAGDALYKAEFEAIHTVPFEANVKRAFELGGIRYGRVDIGLYQGRPQVYEINTNPTVSFSTDHENAHRRKSRAVFVENYCAAIAELNVDLSGAPIELQHAALNKRRRKYRWFQRLRSRPTY